MSKYIDFDVDYQSFGSLLKNIVDNRGRTCPVTTQGTPLIATNCVTNDYLYPQFINIRYVSDEVMKTWFRDHPEPGDLLFVLKGTPGRVAMVPDPVPFAIAQDMVAIRADEKKIYPKYLFAVLRSSIIQQEIEGLHVGTLIPHFKKGDFDELKIPVVNPELQEYVGDQYYLFSQKIDLLQKQNFTLEALAQTYFRKWFIEESEDEWGTLGEYITLYDNKRVPLSAMERAKKQDGVLYPYYGAATIMDYVNDYIFDGEYILLGEDGTVQTPEGYPIMQYATGKFWCNNHAHVLQAKWPYTNYTLWCFLRQCNISHIVTGAVQPKINQQNLRSIEVPKPPVAKLEIANNTIGMLFEKILTNERQIRTLRILRDTLLPKLISGEVKVKQ